VPGGSVFLRGSGHPDVSSPLHGECMGPDGATLPFVVHVVPGGEPVGGVTGRRQHIGDMGPRSGSSAEP
jgi:hypothetical protein